MTQQAKSSAPTWASIDMGSNSFRLEVARLVGDRYQRQLYLKETVRLGAGLDEEGMLTEMATLRGLTTLQRFAEHLKGMAPERVRAVATQTLREAKNRNAFLLRAQAALGFPIEVISGREEARLIFAGVARLQPSDRPRLVIDIGGRSTEMILGQGTQPQRAESFQVGSVSLSLRFFAEGKFTAEAFRAAQIAAGAELEEALNLFRPELWEEALGSSGTVGAVSQILAASGITDGRITPEALRWCMERCLEAGHMQALKLPGLKEDRRAVVGGGLCILYTLLTQFGIAELIPAKGALRQGVIFDLVERQQPGLQAPEMRSASVAELQARFQVDTVQAARVAELAELLYGQIVSRPAPELLRELRWAAALHEIGMMVSHHDHHRHSAYLLAHVDAPGFSQNQLQRLGQLALGQRGGLRKMEIALTDETLLWQLAALRIATVLCHARQPVHVGRLKFSRSDRKLSLSCPASWAKDQARTMYLLREEVDAWAKSGLATLTLDV